MRTYIWVSFALNTLSILALAVTISFSDYPRTQTQPIGLDVFKLLLVCAYAVWAGFLLFN